MQHYIIVKFNEGIDYTKFVEDIKKLFNKALDLDGVMDIEVFTSCIDLPNRYDLMIKMFLVDDGLSNFDNSPIHKEWKDKYGSMISSKTIFDCEGWE